MLACVVVFPLTRWQMFNIALNTVACSFIEVINSHCLFRPDVILLVRDLFCCCIVCPLYSITSHRPKSSFLECFKFLRVKTSTTRKVKIVLINLIDVTEYSSGGSACWCNAGRVLWRLTKHLDPPLCPQANQIKTLIIK